MEQKVEGTVPIVLAGFTLYSAFWKPEVTFTIALVSFVLLSFYFFVWKKRR